MMHTLELRKPDGCRLVLYARAPLPAGLAAPSPSAVPHAPNPHRRRHPLRLAICVASHRQTGPEGAVFVPVA